MTKNAVYDRLVNAPRQHTASLTFMLLHSMQGEEHTGAQVAAAACLFILLCERFGVEAQDAFTAAKNLMNSHDDKLATEFEAIRWYLREEV